MIINEKTKEFITKHLNDNVATLALKSSTGQDVDMRIALRQIDGIQKAKVKFPEFVKYEDILYPNSISLEQCSSSQTAQYKTSIVQGESFTDLSGGFGIDTLALAKKINKGTYVEADRELCEIFSHNATVLDCSNVKAICSKMEDYLPNMPFSDLIYIDPSRRSKSGRRVIELQDLSPNILDYKTILLSKCNTLMLKLSPMLDITALKRQLAEIFEIHIVAVNNECKELVCLLSNEATSSNYKLSAINIKPDSIDTLSSDHERECAFTPLYATEFGDWLFEPNAAIMKSGLYNTLCHTYNIKKIAPKSNLFTSNTIIANFPGRKFKIVEVLPYKSRIDASKLGKFSSASVAVRNFPITAEELRKKLRVKESNTNFLFGTTFGNGRKVVVLCEKV